DGLLVKRQIVRHCREAIWVDTCHTRPIARDRSNSRSRKAAANSAKPSSATDASGLAECGSGFFASVTPVVATATSVSICGSGWLSIIGGGGAGAGRGSTRATGGGGGGTTGTIL